MWCVCLRWRACVNSTYPIALIAGIPLPAFVFRSGGEGLGNVAALPFVVVVMIPCWFFFFFFFHSEAKDIFFSSLCTAAVEVTV